MTKLQEAERLLSEMTRAEKSQILQWVVRDLGDAFPGIESSPDVCGGEPCIVRTRIPVWVLVQARRLGTAEAELLRAYPSLRAEDLAFKSPGDGLPPYEIERLVGRTLRHPVTADAAFTFEHLEELIPELQDADVPAHAEHG